MEKVILLRFGEIYLKGKNRFSFEKQLLDNIKYALRGIKFSLNRMHGRYLIENLADEDVVEVETRVRRVFGLISYSVALKLPTDIEVLKKECLAYLPENGTFRFTVNRADKKFPLNSQQIAMALGGAALTYAPKLKVDLFDPDKEIFVDVREEGYTFLFADKVSCVGGMPVGSSGKGIVLLSGGIDSPVAAYRMAKRGLKMCGVHFHSFPYTSPMAKQKVVDLAKILSTYQGSFDLYVVSFTEIQRAIHENCPEEYMITIMRRIMMRIAERLAKEKGCGSITTGESLAQVASQTQESILVTNETVETLPVFRPLIGMDKEEIIATAREIGTFDKSIEPYEDCCTVFLPKYPVIKPKPELIRAAETKIDYEKLIEEAMKDVEVIRL
ncbi:MAG TPA: tRNA 4-thiouridine(8) synthase ThiI [Clostridiales bacterium]|nr:tRNA 4-thiouridine(8) synthase ThiI [Clostridiales bacterium]